MSSELHLPSTPPARAGSGEAFEPIFATLLLKDPEVVAAVAEYEQGPDRTAFLEVCVKVGVLSLRAARGVVDGDAIRTSGESLLAQLGERLVAHREVVETSLVGTLRNYFDPQHGAFAERVERLISEDGELAQVLQRQVSACSGELRQLLDGFVGSNGQLTKLLGTDGDDNPFVAHLHERMASLLAEQSALVSREFSLDVEGSALGRLVRELKANHGDVARALKEHAHEVVAEFSLDKPDSALSRLVRSVELAQRNITDEFDLNRENSSLRRMLDSINHQIEDQRRQQTDFQAQVVGLLSGLAERKKAEARSTTHGATFEARVGDVLAPLAVGAGDIFVACGATTGIIRNCKVGDFTLQLGPDSQAAGAIIVVEAKEDSSYTMARTIEEADEARRNRQAGTSLFVHSRRTAPAGLKSLMRVGHDVVVTWDSEDDATDVWLEAGLAVAKALSVRRGVADKRTSASFEELDCAIEVMRKQIDGFDELRTTSETIERAAQKQSNRVRIMREQIEGAIERIALQAGVLRLAQEA